MAGSDIVTILEPADEYPHEPDAASNYNESMYFNAFDLEQETGGWFRIGNRVNEGHAEVSVCIYLPDGRVGFMFDRPTIADNSEMNAGGLRVDVVEPFEALRLTYEGKVCLLDDPSQMKDPRTAFRQNPIVDCHVALDWRGVSPMYGGRPVHADGSEIEQVSDKSFAKAHYEQHGAIAGTLAIGDVAIELRALGLRDKSWGPRYWQALSWYRWLPMVFDENFAMMLSIVGGNPEGTQVRAGGMVLEGNEYKLIRECTVESDWDGDLYQTGMRCWARTDDREYEVTGEVMSLIPLRNRRDTPSGEQLFTRITEAMTRYECDGRSGIGMSEYLDQVIDGRPVGPDLP